MDIAASGQPGRSAATTGILSGVGAGALWGLTFLTPKLLPSFSPIEITVGRYLAYGGIAMCLLAPKWRALAPRLDARALAALGCLALVGNILYYILIASAVQTGDVTLPSLIIGFLPVAVTLIGRRDQTAPPLGKLLPSLLLCAAGAVSIGWQAAGGRTPGQAGAHFAGVLCAVGALASWTFYAVSNSRCLMRFRQISPHEWSLLTGVFAGAQSALLAPAAFFVRTGAHRTGDWMQLAAVSIAVATLASILGNALWNRMCRLLPLTLTGQMILFETLFALVYGFLWEWRPPKTAEIISFGLVAVSVLACIAAHHAAGANEPPDGAAASTPKPMPATGS